MTPERFDWLAFNFMFFSPMAAFLIIAAVLWVLGRNKNRL